MAHWTNPNGIAAASRQAVAAFLTQRLVPDAGGAGERDIEDWISLHSSAFVAGVVDSALRKRERLIMDEDAAHDYRIGYHQYNWGSSVIQAMRIAGIDPLDHNTADCAACA